MDLATMSNTRSGFTPHLEWLSLNADNLSHKSNFARKMPVSPNLCGETELQQGSHLCASG